MFGRLLASMADATARATRRAILAFVRFITAFLDLIAEAFPFMHVSVANAIAVLLLLGVLIGVPSALILTRELTGGGGGQTASVAPAAPPAANAPAAPADANAPEATPAEANAPAAPPAANTPAAPELILLRGTFDESALASSLPTLKVVENSIMLVLPRDGGAIGGSVRIVLDNFPAGAILEQIYEGMGGSPDDYPDLGNCMSAVTQSADNIEGIYSPQDQSIKGSTTVMGNVEDRPCLHPLPDDITTDDAAEPADVTLTATFDGRQVVGAFSSESGDLSFKATVAQQ
jgi:hypothetical protein